MRHHAIERGSFAALLATVLLAIVLPAVLLLSACSSPSRKPSIVLVLIDQLRKDAADRWCSSLNALAARGVVFANMRSVAPWTYPAVVSLFSGLYPQQHGADGHLSDDTLTTFDTAVPLLQRILRDSGYRTAAFVTNPFLHTWNPFHEGFELYDVDFINFQGNRRLVRPMFPTDGMFADTVNRAIVTHFDGRPLAAPEFTYVHYIDVHGPWSRAPFHSTYEDATHYVDRHVADLYAYFLRRYAGEVMFLVTSDHGRALDDDEQVGDGPAWRKMKRSVHDFNLRIPFMILPSNLVTEPRVIQTPSSLVDVLPTLLEWLGLPQPYPMPGRSFVPAIRGDETAAAAVPVYAKVSAFGGWSDCVVFRNRKYMRFFDVRTGTVIGTRVFDLDRDPRETMPLADGRDDELARHMEEMAGTHGLRYAARFDDLAPDLEKKLRALGYLHHPR